PILSSPAGAYRSEELVVDMWRNPAKYGASQGVAKPISRGGGGSVHQNGRCIDVNNWASFGDLVVSRGFRRSRRRDTLAAAHGVYPDARYPNEPWHYQHNGTTPAGGITEGPFDMLSDTEQTELLNKTREIHDVIFNPWYGIKWRQLAQHYWMLGQPLPQDIIAENDLHTTPDSPFREMVSANLPSSVADLPTNGEMGQALTSTVALVNEHADGNKDAI